MPIAHGMGADPATLTALVPADDHASRDELLAAGATLRGLDATAGAYSLSRG